MKKKITILGMGIMMVLSVSAQESNIEKVDLVVENTSTKYYAEPTDYKVDEEGRISGSIISYHENGSMEEKGILLNGEKHGAWELYAENGTKTGEGNYLNGQKHGVWKVWDKNGTQRIIMEYDNGKRVGVWKMFDETGALSSEKTYD